MSKRRGSRPVLASAVVGLLLLSGCTDRPKEGGGGAAQRGGSAGACTDLARELTKTRRPKMDVAAAAGMCRPPDWTVAEVATDIAVAGDTVWLASADCSVASRVWRSTDRGRTWRQTGKLHAVLHCSAGSSIELKARDSRHAQAAVTNGALIETQTIETNDAGRSWATVGIRCLNSDDPRACG